MKKPSSGTIVLIVIISIIAVLIILGTSKGKSNDSSSTVNQAATYVNKQRSDYIAEIYLEGEITQKTKTYDQQWLLNTIRELKNNAKNKALVVFINSPGGSVYEADEVYLALKDYRNAGKLVYVYQGSMAASGGYYISCAANKIYANRNTLTGSIGVIAGQSIDVSELLTRYGIKAETIHAGKNKNMGSMTQPLTDEQRQILQSVADECYDQFTQIVSLERNLKMDEVRKLSDGRIYTAKQALELKLIDKISTHEEMLDDLKVEIQNQNCSVVPFKVPEEKSSIFDILSSLSSKASDSFDLNSMALPYIPKSVKEELESPVEYPAFIYR